MDDARLGSRLSALIWVVGIVWLVQQVVPPLQTISDILLLFFLAWLIAFILEPLVTIQEHLHIARSVAVALIYGVLLFGLALIGVLVGPALADQLGQLRENLPSLAAQLPSQDEVTKFFVGLGLPARDISAIYQPQALAAQLQASAGSLLQTALAVATSALNAVVNLALLLIISFYMLLDGRKIAWTGLRLLSAKRRDNAMVVLTQVSANFGGFLRGQVIQALVFGGIVALLMIVLRMEFIAVTALSSAALMLIPLVGPILALIPPLVVALFHPQSVVISVLVVLGVAQAVLVNAIMPRILSQQIGLPPLLVFLAILLGLRLGGPLGAFFGIPIMGVLYGTAIVLYGRWKNGEDDKKQQSAASGPTERTRTNSP